MPIQVDQKTNDALVQFVAPQTDTDARVPTAEELSVAGSLLLNHIYESRKLKPSGITTRPIFAATVGSKGVVIPSDLGFYSQKHPTLGILGGNHTLVLPSLADTVSAVSRYDRIYLMGFRAVVTADIDPDIQLEFSWRDQSSTIQTQTKENTRREREFYAFVWGSGEVTASAVWAVLPEVSGERQLTANKTAGGIETGTLQIYPLDNNLVADATYTVVEDSLEMIELLRVWRVQNTIQDGYRWGRTGESDFQERFNLQPSYRYVGPEWDLWQARLSESIHRLFRGLSLSDTPTDNRIVLNLVNGQVASTLDAPGIATASPNGSTALANEQRMIFTNQAILQQEFCLPLTLADNGGAAEATVNFAGNSPSGARFGPNNTDHKIYSKNGIESSDNGSYTGEGGTGALTWLDTNDTEMQPGDIAYLVPGIEYPAGSGFPIAGKGLEAVYLNSVAINASNIKSADLTAYEEPANSEDHIIVFDQARGSIRIYKKYTVNSNGSGIAAIPSTARGVIAFIDGPSAPSARQDVPILSGLSNNSTYNLLVSHAPPGSEQWQFQFIEASYAGLSSTGIIDDSIVLGDPIFFGNSQGGGNANDGGDGELGRELIALRLPVNTDAGAQDAYLFNTKIQPAGTAALPDSATFSQLTHHLASNGNTLPKQGQTLTAIAAASVQSQGLAIRLESDGVSLGVLKTQLESSSAYQLIVGFLIEKNEQRYMVVCALNAGDGSTYESTQLNTDGPNYAAIDVFNLY
ncbi:hypothetical protein [Leptothoe spongobia]|uniref:Uncharacterized protein n=1 Tax=Leptothoe spongobia TAU-MAC 1115 TaxID=1967444 RepID=A0A947GKD2_9CYAN|nr:hypothetical protein [Leptothoe spongobia]MBT9316272.1 hypothetical protein [Leptothoe spongobia TAU-MAC 1115]